MLFYDSHCHLNDEQFNDDFYETIERAASAGVNRIMLIAYDKESCLSMPDYVVRHPNLRAAVGIHPHDASRYFIENCEADLRRLLDSKLENRILALGEIGLDYHYDFCPKDLQKEVFYAQIKLAHEYDLPIIIHDREAHRDCLDILQEAKREGLLKNTEAGVFHCYSGSPELLDEVLSLGFYIGFDGPLTFKNSKNLPQVLSKVRRDRYLIETDSPYLAPVPFRGKRNEPAYVVKVAEKIAELLQIDLETVAEESYQNTVRLWGD